MSHHVCGAFHHVVAVATQDGKDPDSPSFGVLNGACGYGQLNRSAWPYWRAVGLSSSNPIVAKSSAKDACGTCIKLTCTASVSLGIIHTSLRCNMLLSNMLHHLHKCMLLSCIHTAVALAALQHSSAMHLCWYLYLAFVSALSLQGCCD